MPKKIFTEEEKEEIIRLYTIEKMGAKLLGQKFGCSAPTLLKNLSEWGIKPNTKKLDLTNQQFGELIAIKPANSRNDRYTRWICKCSCGKEVEVRTDYLTNGHTTSCGHIKEQFFSRAEIKPGDVFGKLIALEYIPVGKWKCKCKCGNEIIVLTYNLTNGNTQSCGCLKSKGELKINNLLTELNINFKTQYSFEDCRFLETNRLAFFDYAIFDDNNKLLCLIEYDGIQHRYGWDYNNDSLEKIQEKDNFKNEYCLKKNIPLIRISYKDYNKINYQFLLELIESVKKRNESSEI